jgi:hypothetical protein
MADVGPSGSQGRGVVNGPSGTPYGAGPFWLTDKVSLAVIVVEHRKDGEARGTAGGSSQAGQLGLAAVGSSLWQ